MATTPSDFDPDGPWRERAACRDYPQDWWFANKNGTTYDTNLAAQRRAEAICATCPVRAECRQAKAFYEALDGRKTYGVWGGKAEPELATMEVVRRPMPGFKHGTYAGYRCHVRRAELPCLECAKANTAYRAEYKRTQRAAAREAYKRDQATKKARKEAS